MVAKVATFLQSKNMTVSTAVEFGDAKSDILRVAEDWHADLIVVGSHGRTGLDRFLLGSVADTLVRYSQCSTEVVRVLPGTQAPESLVRLGGGAIGKILLPIDGSQFSDAAVQFVSERMPTDAKEIRLLCVVETAMLAVLRKVAGKLRAIQDAEAKLAGGALKKAATKLRSKGFSTSTAIKYGDPKSKILEQATDWGADLIVLGSHGRKGLKHFLLGSVSEAVARHARCSVEIVRIPSEPQC